MRDLVLPLYFNEPLPTKKDSVQSSVDQITQKISHRFFSFFTIKYKCWAERKAFTSIEL